MKNRHSCPNKICTLRSLTHVNMDKCGEKCSRVSQMWKLARVHEKLVQYDSCQNRTRALQILHCRTSVKLRLYENYETIMSSWTAIQPMLHFYTRVKMDMSPIKFLSVWNMSKWDTCMTRFVRYETCPKETLEQYFSYSITGVKMWHVGNQWFTVWQVSKRETCTFIFVSYDTSQNGCVRNQLLCFWTRVKWTLV